MEFLQEINLELNSNTAYTTVGAKQGDASSRVIKIHVTENGEDWVIPAGVAVSYRVRKPDGYAIWNEGIIDTDENVVYITLTEQTLAAAGRAYADIYFESGTNEDRQILSTVSFIIIIMAAPDIVENIASSNEFSRILDLTNNADVILNEAEAWAVGSKAGIPVVEDNFEYSVIGNSGLHVTIDSEVFRSYVGRNPGYTVYYVFTCIESASSEAPLGVWQVSYLNNLLLDITLADYGITFTGHPLQSNIIRVVVTDSDIQYENNSKYYAEQARSSQQAIEALSVSAETVPDMQHGGQAEVIKTIVDDVVNFHFKIPKGDVGDVNFMTFDVNMDTGELIMYKPDDMSPQVDFSLNNNDGKLYVEIVN